MVEPKVRWQLALLILTLLVGVGCGKKAEVIESRPTPTVDPVTGEMEAQLKLQSVICDAGLSCPGGMAKIAIIDNNKLKFCTGFLVNSVTLATASSCLTETLRISEDDTRCQKDLHVFFPRAGFSGAQRVGCQKLLFASPIQGNDPVLWRQDIAYIELSEPVFRRSVRLNRGGLVNNEKLTIWKVDADNNQLGVIRKDECDVIQNSYVNPLFDSNFNPTALLSGCAFKEGNAGALILGPQQGWRGVVSKPLSAALERVVRQNEVEPLQPILHVSNGSCIQSILESDAPSARECFRNLDNDEIDARRADMLTNLSPYQVNRQAVEDNVNQIRPYFNWRADLVENTENGGYDIELTPVCMRPIADWIDLVGRGTRRFVYSKIVPRWKLTLGFDRGARLVSRMDTTESQKIFVQFFPRTVWNSQKTDMFVWKEGMPARNFNDVKTCE